MVVPWSKLSKRAKALLTVGVFLYGFVTFALVLSGHPLIAWGLMGLVLLGSVTLLCWAFAIIWGNRQTNVRDSEDSSRW